MCPADSLREVKEAFNPAEHWLDSGIWPVVSLVIVSAPFIHVFDVHVRALNVK